MEVEMDTKDFKPYIPAEKITPEFTVTSIIMGLLAVCVAGAPLTETVFAWPGVGKLIIEAVQLRDTPLACGLLTMKCGIIALLGLVEDIIYVFIDPRIKSMYTSSRRAKIK